MSRRPRELTVPAFAKVNLGLEVLGVREDGYHELRTIFQAVSLRDDITLRWRRSGITVECAHAQVPQDRTNLAVQAAEALQRYARVKEGVEIVVEKRIPVAGGLGGGSSDAASTLIGLDALWRTGLGRAGLYPLARRIGADVPFFLWGGTALGLGRGDEIYPLHRQIDAYCLVVDPGRPVSTAAVFRRCDQWLTPRENSYSINRFVSRDLEGPYAFQGLTNELEEAALEEAPDLAHKLKDIRGVLVREGALLARLSGSGSAFFGLFADAARARRAEQRLRRVGCAVWRVRTLTYERYQGLWARAMGRNSRSARVRSAQHGDHGRQGHSGR